MARDPAFFTAVHETTTFLGVSPPTVAPSPSIDKSPCYRRQPTVASQCQCPAVLPIAMRPRGLFPISSGIDTKRLHIELSALRSVPKTSGIGAVEALTPSTAGRAGLAQRALPRRAGRPLGPHRPRHLPTRRRVDRRLGSDRGRHAPPRRYDLPGLRTHAPRPDRRDPRRAGHRHPPLVEDTGQHRRDCVAPLRPGHILDRTRRDHDPGIGSDNRNLTHPSARSPIHSGSATKSVTNWRVTRCESGCAEAANPPG